MNAIKLCASAFVLAIVGQLVACNDDNPTQIDGDTDAGTGGNSVDSSTGYDAGQKDTGPAPNVCVPKCASDSDCQTSCPPIKDGVNCCDVPSGACFSSPGSMCPMPHADAGSSNGGYN